MKPLEERVADLEEEVAYLKSELGLSSDLTKVAALMDCGLTRGEARAVVALRSTNGRVLSRSQVADATGLTDQTVKVVVCRVSNKMAGIETARGLGYRLTSEGMRWVDDHLSLSVAA